jgi:hypothetical protein
MARVLSHGFLEQRRTLTNRWPALYLPRVKMARPYQVLELTERIHVLGFQIVYILLGR